MWDSGSQPYLRLYKSPQFASTLERLFSMEKSFDLIVSVSILACFCFRIACLNYYVPFILFSFYLGILVSGWQWIVLTWRRPRGQVQALGWGVLAAATISERDSRAPAVTARGMETAFRIAIDRREGGWPYQKTPIEARVISARTWPQRLWRKIAHYGSAMLVVHVRSVVYIEFVVANGTLAMRWFSLDLKQGLN